MSLPRELSLQTVDTVVGHFDLVEQTAPDGGPLLPIAAPAFGGAPAGELRVWRGDGPVRKAVYVGLAVDQIGLDSHMLFAFAAADSALPHFTLDSVSARGYYAYHLDLIPRVELASHLEYVEHVYTPLTPTFHDVQDWEGLSATTVGPRQVAMMSPWMLFNRCTEDAFRRVAGAVDIYLDHWKALLDKGLPDDVSETLADTDLADRDRRNRSNIFSPLVDPVWEQVGQLVGLEVREQIRGQLLSNEA